MSLPLLPLLLPLVLSQSSSCQQWPRPSHDRLDSLLFEGLTQGGFTLANKVERCIGIRTVSPIAAEWMRVAFHDVATHDSSTGEGGLDYSIAFELDRTENVGPGQEASLEEYRTASNPYYSQADLIAMGVVFSSISCQGPYMHFRSGRIDSYKAGPAGVPQAHEDIETHTSRFRTMGFSEKEMIQLTACGHSMGGVRNSDFPNIDTADGGILMFDKTRATLDNAVLKEYLSGETINPLVVDRNSTLRSDLRVFSSDNNATVTEMATSSSAFNAICGPLLERFISTVPSSVTLSEPYEPQQYKVDPVLFAIESGKLTINTGLRVLDLADEPTRTVRMLWTGAGDSTASSTTAAATSTITGVVMAAANHTALRYTFSAPTDPDHGIERFSFEIVDSRGTTTVDNGGCGYVFSGHERLVLWDQSRSRGDRNGKLIVAGIHKSVTPSEVGVVLYAHSELKVPTNTTVPLLRNTSIPDEAGYSFYSAYATQAFNAFTVQATVGGETWSAEAVDAGLIFAGEKRGNSSTVIPYTPKANGTQGQSGALRLEGGGLGGPMAWMGIVGIVGAGLWVL